MLHIPGLGFADELLTGSRDPIFNADKKPDEEEPEPDGDGTETEPAEPDEDDNGKPSKKGSPFPPRKTLQGVVFARRTWEQQLVAACTHHQPDARPGSPSSVLPAGSRGRRIVDLYAQLTNRAH